MTASRKQSLYFPAAMLKEMQAEQERLLRSKSWLARRAWQLAHDAIRVAPSAEAVETQVRICPICGKSGVVGEQRRVHTQVVETTGLIFPQGTGRVKVGETLTITHEDGHTCTDKI